MMGFLDNAGLAHVWEKVKTALSAKQDKLTGTAGQVVGFNAAGQAVAQAAPEGGITQKEADGRYLQLMGGTMKGAIKLPGTYPALEFSVISAPPLDGTIYGTAYSKLNASKPIPAFFTRANFSGSYTTEFGFISESAEVKESLSVRLTGIDTPTKNNDAANKKYVDNAIAALNERIVALEAYLGS